MDPILLLQELSTGWNVNVFQSLSDDRVWTVSISRDHREHCYWGSDLARCIRAAWAGEPSGKVG